MPVKALGHYVSRNANVAVYGEHSSLGKRGPFPARTLYLYNLVPTFMFPFTVDRIRFSRVAIAVLSGPSALSRSSSFFPFYVGSYIAIPRGICYPHYFTPFIY